MLSDHNPISITLTLPNTLSRAIIWRLDNSLLTDTDNIKWITTSLSNYFAENTSEDISPTVTWATHKCVIRGELISLAAKQNKLRKAHINDLTTRIRTLERSHKVSLAASSLAELTQTREEVLEELNQTLNLKFAMTQKLFYEFSNNASKLLARALQAKKAAHTIHAIKYPSGDTLVTTEDISEQFIQYFTKLYKLPHTHPTKATPDRMTAITDFLAQKVHPLSPQTSRQNEISLSL